MGMPHTAPDDDSYARKLRVKRRKKKRAKKRAVERAEETLIALHDIAHALNLIAINGRKDFDNGEPGR